MTTDSTRSTKSIFLRLHGRAMTNEEITEFLIEHRRATEAEVEISTYIRAGKLNYVTAFVECSRAKPDCFIYYVAALWRYLREHPDFMARRPELRSLLIRKKLKDFASRNLLMEVEAQHMREFLRWIKGRADYVA